MSCLDKRGRSREGVLWLVDGERLAYTSVLAARMERLLFKSSTSEDRENGPPETSHGPLLIADIFSLLQTTLPHSFLSVQWTIEI
jgi:hypothetical protein